ncbi:tetratricopeptide repeat protein [Tessaracoccus sp. HDW20]|uniref:tetratricopeptide repeat protein n=1 Tax=Tessaracoccus coleopterorum TaxID=2714950 RepID=UPI0018D36E52|nr:tetratricopeptide repeat protein [Tessaracoccus coleopterorum]NHB84176.1 tetratricopeptide repeat protein [Tessaracoccus coleopterorum]
MIAALVYGIFRIGLPQEPGDQAAGQPTATASTGSGAARMAELEAKLLSSPDDVAVNLELGVLHFNAGDSGRAEELWTKVTQLDPRNPQAWFNLGFVHLAEDPPDTAGAKADWDKVLEVAPDSDLAATVESHLDALEAMGAPSPTPNPTEE